MIGYTTVALVDEEGCRFCVRAWVRQPKNVSAESNIIAVATFYDGAQYCTRG